MQAVLAIHGTGYNSDGSDVDAFRNRALNITNKIPGATKHPINTGKSFVNLLVEKTKDEGSIQSFITYTHGGGTAIVLEESSGFYTNDQLGIGGNENSRYIKDLNKSIENGDIKFESNSIAIFAGCNNGNTYTEFGIAENFTKETGVTAIAADGRVAPEIVNGKETGNLFAFEEQFYKFERQENGSVNVIPLGQIIDPVRYLNPPIEKIEPIKGFVEVVH